MMVEWGQDGNKRLVGKMNVQSVICVGWIFCPDGAKQQKVGGKWVKIYFYLFLAHSVVPAANPVAESPGPLASEMGGDLSPGAYEIVRYAAHADDVLCGYLQIHEL